MAHSPPRGASKSTSTWVRIVASETVRAWLQTLVIIAGALFGVYEFYLKEVWWPATAPINLSTEVTIKEAGVSASNESKELEAIELVVKARNPSNRTVYLLKNYWRAWGVKCHRKMPSLSDSVGWPEFLDT
jgi:hypothetical protein